MAKGFFTQGIAVLFETAPDLDALAAALHPREIRGRRDAATASEWVFGGPTFVVPYRPQQNGMVAVDVAPHRWPDTMGDPQQDSLVFGAWALGQFGPLTFPGNLTRAGQQAWHWKEAEQRAARHQAFVRLRCSYVFGKVEENVPVLPAQYEPRPELLFITELAVALLSAPGALCLFNPAGEVLCGREEAERLLKRHRTTGPEAQELWCNVRMFQLPHDPAWLLMDTAGMAQLDAPDHEACFARDRYDPSEVARFLRNAADYVLRNGAVIKDGDTMDGPGGIRWQGKTFDKSVAPAPRPVLRWLPMDGARPPREIVEAE